MWLTQAQGPGTAQQRFIPTRLIFTDQSPTADHRSSLLDTAPRLLWEDSRFSTTSGSCPHNPKQPLGSSHGTERNREAAWSPRAWPAGTWHHCTNASLQTEGATPECRLQKDEAARSTGDPTCRGSPGCICTNDSANYTCRLWQRLTRTGLLHVPRATLDVSKGRRAMVSCWYRDLGR